MHPASSGQRPRESAGSLVSGDAAVDPGINRSVDA
jgi:hypothetical protein